MSRRFSTPMRPISEFLSGQSAYRPSTSVRMISFLAPSAAASAAAAESALTFSTSVASSSSGATEETTGMRPAEIRSSTAEASTLTTSPTSPMSVGLPSMMGLRCMAENRAPSSPDSPTANGPCALISPTSSLDTLPVSTMRTTSMASGVVTRRPPSMNSTGMSSFSSILLMPGPPPWLSTGFMPRSLSSTTSCMTASLSSSLIMALPPYFTTMRCPANSSSHGSASISTSAFWSARRSVCTSKWNPGPFSSVAIFSSIASRFSGRHVPGRNRETSFRNRH